MVNSAVKSLESEHRQVAHYIGSSCNISLFQQDAKRVYFPAFTGYGPIQKKASIPCLRLLVWTTHHLLFCDLCCLHQPFNPSAVLGPLLLSSTYIPLCPSQALPAIPVSQWHPTGLSQEAGIPFSLHPNYCLEGDKLLCICHPHITETMDDNSKPCITYLKTISHCIPQCVMIWVSDAFMCECIYLRIMWSFSCHVYCTMGSTHGIGHLTSPRGYS